MSLSINSIRTPIILDKSISREQRHKQHGINPSLSFDEASSNYRAAPELCVNHIV